MARQVSILYSFRDRSLEIVKTSLDSLKEQSWKEFEVVFLDYGSHNTSPEALKDLVESYDFCTYVGVRGAQGMLWSRSKALNLAIKKARYDLIFIVDIDLYFAPEALEVSLDSFEEGKYLGGDWVFLSKKESEEFLEGVRKPNWGSAKISDDNGMLLIEKSALEKIEGYDEFFHLYGGEDTDLKNRLFLAGYQNEKIKTPFLFFHIWHPHVIIKRTSQLLGFPYIHNVKRINEKHVFYNSDNKLVKGNSINQWGKFPEELGDQVDYISFVFENIHSRLIHFFYHSLPQLSEGYYEIEIVEKKRVKGIKSRIKEIVKKSSEIEMGMQEVNEMISALLLFNYRNHSYWYRIDPEKRSITLRIKI